MRKARPDDWLAVATLHRGAWRRLPQLWWWEEHLADGPFVVTEHGGIVSGALFAWPDDSPVAWIRLAALNNDLDTGKWLGLALPPVLDSLRRLGTQKLAWLDHDDWVGPHLEARGFRRLTDVITLSKFDRCLPETNAVDARVHPALDTDVPASMAVDRAAFTPHWWYSESTMLRRIATSSHFAVARAAGKVIGYVEGDVHPPLAHLNRIAVHPAHQGHGVGALLLHDALCAFWRLGANQVSLNTQIDNHDSLRLYRRFGFEPVGDSVIVWELEL